MPTSVSLLIPRLAALTGFNTTCLYGMVDISLPGSNHDPKASARAALDVAAPALQITELFA
ncbi:hypothetical protein SAMN00790413_04858 [Deinococcus hopiensis KR-140]|uniref:Uncharacterized protein n=1 Tax=Deinococcus hopiensis KR-140 TaxID=695939 RepID=A0A1W1UM78_9DEIO|nr:hypothetical protein SAMN00790413_04858 [Deinococcus hopiensis KR-140]